jgi:hypothetical protein
MSVEMERPGRSVRGHNWGLVFAWIDCGKTHGHFRQHRWCRGRDWNETITEAKKITYFLKPTYQEKMWKVCLQKTRWPPRWNANCRVKNMLYLKTHLDAAFKPYFRAISAHYCSQDTFQYSKALRGNCIKMREKIFCHRRVVGKLCVW